MSGGKPRVLQGKAGLGNGNLRDLPQEETLSPRRGICECRGVIDPFQQAVAETLPVLKNIQAGFGPPPAVSSAALARLQALSSRNASPAPVSFESRTRESPLEIKPRPTQATAGKSHPLVSSAKTHADVLFIDETPEGPTSKEAGVLLGKIVQAMGLSRTEVVIGTLHEGRLLIPQNSPDRSAPAASPSSLAEQIASLAPRTIVASGATTIKALLGLAEPVETQRGQFRDFHGIPVITTLSPAHLVRHPSITEKRKVWEDMLMVLEKLGKPISEKQRQFFTKAG